MYQKIFSIIFNLFFFFSLCRKKDKTSNNSRHYWGEKKVGGAMNEDLPHQTTPLALTSSLSPLASRLQHARARAPTPWISLFQAWSGPNLFYHICVFKFVHITSREKFQHLEKDQSVCEDLGDTSQVHRPGILMEDIKHCGLACLHSGQEVEVDGNRKTKNQQSTWSNSNIHIR